MTKLAAIILLYSILATGSVPDVKVSGAMKNIMVNGDLSAHINLDTLNKTNLYTDTRGNNGLFTGELKFPQ